LRAGAVTVVITAYNAERYIGRAIRSALDQHPAPARVLVVDDGSDDETAAVANRVSPDVRVLRFGSNRGPAAGRTLGLERAETEFVAFLDADDYWLPGFLKQTVPFLQTHPELVAVVTGYRKIDWKQAEYVRPELDEEDQALFGNGGGALPDFYSFWARYRGVLTGTVIMRTAVAKRTGGQREDLRLTQDLEFWGYLATHGPWGFLPIPLFATDERALTPRARLVKFRRRFSFFQTLTIDKWSARIRAHLPPQASGSYRRLEGHIASTIAMACAYMGDYAKAWDVVHEWRDELDTGVAAWLRKGHALGRLTWPLFCMAVPLREYLKAYGHHLLRRLKGSAGLHSRANEQ